MAISVAYPLLERDFVDVAGTGDRVVPGVLVWLGQLGDDPCEEDLPVQHKAGHVDLHRELVASLGDTVYGIETSVFLFLGGIRMLADILESVISTLANALAMLLLVALRNNHLCVCERESVCVYMHR